MLKKIEFLLFPWGDRRCSTGRSGSGTSSGKEYGFIRNKAGYSDHSDSWLQNSGYIEFQPGSALLRLSCDPSCWMMSLVFPQSISWQDYKHEIFILIFCKKHWFYRGFRWKKVLYFIAKRVKIIEKRYIFLEKTEKDVTIKNGEKMKNNSVFKWS